jgi:acyl carrier protein
MSGNLASFEEVCQIIRDQAQLDPDERITPETQFERDLGITGDDGSEIIDSVEKHYGIQFTPDSFGLEPNEYLFNSEGIDLIPGFLRILFNKPEPEVRSFTVGELYDAVVKELSKAPQSLDA